jgi:hypothetical protein
MGSPGPDLVVAQMVLDHAQVAAGAHQLVDAMHAALVRRLAVTRSTVDAGADGSGPRKGAGRGRAETPPGLSISSRPVRL